MAGNKKDPLFVVLKIARTPLNGIVMSVTALHTFDAREDARTFATEKNVRARGNTVFKVQRVTPGPINRKK